MVSGLSAVEVVEVEALPCLGVARDDVGPDQLGDVFMSAIPEVDAALRAAHLDPAEDLVALYRRLEGMRFALHIGRPSKGAEAPRGLMAFVVPAGRVARLVHVGSYDQLGAVTRDLLAWCSERGLEATGDSWEVYHHLETPEDPSTYRTTVCVRVEGDVPR